MGPVGRVHSNFEDNGDQVYFVPSNFATGCHFSLDKVPVLVSLQPISTKYNRDADVRDQWTRTSCIRIDLFKSC